MKLLKLIFYRMAAFVERNPVFCLLMLLCAVVAPWLFKSVLTILMYVVLAFVVVGLVIFGSMAWRLRSIRRQMREGMGSNAGGKAWGGFARERGADRGRDGEVKVHRTAGARRKRVSDNVGDYVDFEEVGDSDNE